jgi:ATP synthase protein I
MPSSAAMHPLKDVGRYGTVGIELLVSMALGYYGGRWLDARWSTGGWFAGGGAFLGVVVGFYSLWKASRTMMRDIEEAERRERDARK